MMKKLLLLFVLLLIPLAVAEEPPALENHQFYGKVFWDVGEDTPDEVVVEVGVNEYSSSITDGTCDGDLCDGLYGYTELLLVQGDNGDIVTFFVDGIEVAKENYVAWESTNVPLDITTEQVAPQECVADYSDCDAWSSCSGGVKTRTCKDLNLCDVDQLEVEEEKSCSVSSDGSDGSGDVVKKEDAEDEEEVDEGKVCLYSWTCGGWSECAEGGIQSRNCVRDDSCDEELEDGDVDSILKLDKPSEKRLCGEEGAFIPPTSSSSSEGLGLPSDSSLGLSGSSSSSTDGVSIWVYVGAGIFVVLVIGILLLLHLRKKSGLTEGVKAELRSIYSQGSQRGMSKQQVTQKLIQKGWDEKMLRKFLKK